MITNTNISFRYNTFVSSVRSYTKVITKVFLIIFDGGFVISNTMLEIHCTRILWTHILQYVHLHSVLFSVSLQCQKAGILPSVLTLYRHTQRNLHGHIAPQAVRHFSRYLHSHALSSVLRGKKNRL